MGILLDSAADIYSAKNNLVEIPAGGDPLQYWDDTAANQVRNLAVEVHAALRGQLDTGKHFVGMGDNAADPDMLASLGAGVSYIYGTASVAKRKRSGSGGLTTMLDSVGDTATSSSGTDRPWSLAPVVNQSGTAGYTAWQVNVTETATGSGSKLLFDWQVGGTSKLRAWNTGSLDFGAGSTAAVSASGRGAIRFNEGTNAFQQSVNGGAWSAFGGGGGIADGDNVVWTGEHSFEGVSFNVNPLATFAGNVEIATTKTLKAGANTLISSDLLQLGKSTWASAARGDLLVMNATPAPVRLAVGAAGTLLAGGTDPAYTATPTVTSITTGNGSAGSPSVVIGDAGGLYRIADNRIGVAPNGTLTVDFAETYMALAAAVTLHCGAPGSTTVPGVTWIGDQNTGFSNHTADQIGVILGGVERMLFRAPSSVGRLEVDECRAKNGQDYFMIRATGKAIFGTETSGNILEMQSYRTTGATTNAFQLWAFAGTATAGNLLSIGDGGSYAQKLGVDYEGRLDVITAITQTTVGSAGAASALPGAPTGYLQVRVGGTSGSAGTIKLIPYWDWDGP